MATHGTKAIVAWNLLTAVFMSGPYMTARATSIVAVRTPIDVSIAADSCGTFGADDHECRNVCKIYKVGDYFLGVAGMDKDNPRNFSIAQIFMDGAVGQGTVKQKIAVAENALTSGIRDEAAWLKGNSPKDFAKITNPNAPAVSIVVIGIDDGVPFAMQRDFRIVIDSGSIRVDIPKRTGCPGRDCPTGLKGFFLGQIDAITRVVSDGFRISDSSSTARSLVQLEVSARAEGVGPPIDVLRLTAKGVEGNQKSGCPDTIQPSKNVLHPKVKQ